jgi:hypothetical protein
MIASCRQLHDTIVRTAAYNKLATRMTEEDAERHRRWRDQLKDYFAALFMSWDLRATARQVTESQAADVDLFRACAKRVIERIRWAVNNCLNNISLILKLFYTIATHGSIL